MKRHLLLLCSLFLSGLLWGQALPPVLKIVVTTDVHGALFPGDWFSERTLPGSLAQVYSYVKSARDKGETVVLLDNGDLLQGDPSVYYSNFITPGEINIAARVLNFMGYDAASMGNHDIETGHPVYDKIKSQYHFPWLAANAISTTTGKPAFHPYSIIEKNGIKLAVVGLVTPKIPDWLPPVLWTGIVFDDMISTARYWIEYVDQNEHPDLMIGLFHSGVDQSYNNEKATAWMNENASRLIAEQVPGFDIIFAGHDHQHHNDWVVNTTGDSVLLLDSESRAREMGVVTVYDPSRGDRQSSLIFKGNHIDVSKLLPDAGYMSAFSGFIDTVQRWVDQPVAFFGSSFNSEDAYFGVSPFLDLIHRAQLNITGATISFAAPLSFRTILPAGTMTLGSLFQLYRYENMLYTLELSGQEILDYLNFSYGLWVKQMSGDQDPMLRMTEQSSGSWRFDKAYYNFDAAAGLVYEVDLRLPVGQMVKIISLSNGHEFDLNAKYRVAINSYRGSGGGGHLTEGAKLTREELESRIISVSDQDFRFHLMEWASKQKPKSGELPVIHPVIISRWTFVPESWAQSATMRERPLLFRDR